MPILLLILLVIIFVEVPSEARKQNEQSDSAQHINSPTVREGLARKQPGQLDTARQAIGKLLSGNFEWKSTGPLLGPSERPEDPCHAVKDPSVVRFNDRWHVFCTIRSKKRTHQIEYISFPDWNQTALDTREVLTLTDGYFCAPQVFYFTPQKKWYLIYQVSEPSRRPELQPAFSTTDTLNNPKSWSKPILLFRKPPDNIKQWIDFWVVCDNRKAQLFFTSLDGQMWRSETKLASFPDGWDTPRVVLKDDIYEASHTYRLKGVDKYLTIAEAQADGRRYYKAFLADALDGVWRPLAASREHPFVGPDLVKFQGERWTDSFSHGELLRTGNDEHLEVDPAHLRFLYQGVSDEARRGKSYGEIPWRLGLLSLVASR